MTVIKPRAVSLQHLGAVFSALVYRSPVECDLKHENGVGESDSSLRISKGDTSTLPPHECRELLRFVYNPKMSKQESGQRTLLHASDETGSRCRACRSATWPSVHTIQIRDGPLLAGKARRTRHVVLTTLPAFGRPGSRRDKTRHYEARASPDDPPLSLHSKVHTQQRTYKRLYTCVIRRNWMKRLFAYCNDRKPAQATRSRCATVRHPLIVETNPN